MRAIVAVIGVIVIGRLFQVSVIDHRKAMAAAKNQYSVKQTVEAKRGKIYFRDLGGGKNFPVALNVDSFTIIADPFLLKEPLGVAQALSGPLALPTEELLPKLSDPKKRFIILKKKLTKPEAEAIEKLNLKGIDIQTVPTRSYPEGSLAAQLIGFVNSEGEGKYGLEGFFNEDLKGYDGSLIGEKDAKRRIIVESKSAQPKDGTEIVSTIDHNVQFIVERKLKEAIEKFQADSGSIVITDVKTGAVLAMASYPNYDLNNYNTVPADQQQRFINQAVSSAWEPGSIFKTFTLAAGMDKGLFEPSTELSLNCVEEVNGYKIHNAEDKCYPHPTIIQVLADSINLGTMWAANQLGNDNFAQYLTAFGFGEKTGIEVQPESAGKLQEVKKWQDVNRATYSFGQGLSTTPLQIVNAYGAIANGGRLMRPYVVAKRIEADGREIVTQPKEVRQVIKPETAAKATQLLEKVVTEGHGKRAAVKGYKIAGKTGTAQVVGDDGRYAENQHIGSFAGYFPSNDPKFAMVVKLDRPKTVEFAESSAAPTFGEIAQWLLHYAKVPPTEAIQ